MRRPGHRIDMHCWLIMLLLFASSAYGQRCDQVFPGAAQSSANNGRVSFYWGARLINTPGNLVRTRNLVDYAGNNTSCNGVSCTATNTIVPDINTSATTSNTSYYIPFNYTLQPGRYNRIEVGSNITLTLLPGVYEMNDLVFYSGSRLVISSPGTTSIILNGDFSTNYAVNINANGAAGRYLFIYARGSIELASNSTTRAIVYARGNVTTQNGASLVGAATANSQIVVNSGSSITYDANAVAQTEFGSVCSPAYETPNLVAEWRLDEISWNGTANEVRDSSGNNFHGRAVNYNRLPSSAIATPVRPGSPGTCRYGSFNNVNDGYVQINDPGNNSALDLTSYSLMAWIYARTYAVNDTLMTVVSKDENYEFHVDNYGRIFWWWGGGNQSLRTTATISRNAWHHIAVTYSRGNQLIYIDGVQQASSNNTQDVQLNNDPVNIGSDFTYPSRMFNGYIDEVRLYDGALNAEDVNRFMNESHPCIPENVLDHFDIAVGATDASTCVPQEIIITAKNDRDETLDGYTGTVSLTTSTNNGRWTKTNDPTDARGGLTATTNDSGTATYVFANNESDAGEITLNLANQHAERLTITVADNDEGISSTSEEIRFSDNAFVVSSPDALADDVIVGRDHLFNVAMYTRDDAGNCAIATDYSAAQVKASVTRTANDPGGTAPALVNSTNTAVLLPSATPATDNVTFPFVNGSADFRLRTSDAGEYSIQFRDDSSGFADEPIVGGSQTLVVRPFAFDLSITGNPVATGAGGPVFRAAGAPFTVNVRAVAWQAEDAVAGTGVAVGHTDAQPGNEADLSNNATVTHFGSDTVHLAVDYADPGIGDLLGTVDLSFSNGVASTTLAFDEVGVIGLAASVSDGGYLSAGTLRTARLQGRSGYVGRFIPANFTVNNALLTPACSTFSYMGEDFSVAYQLQATNTQGAITRNYTGAYAKLLASDLAYVAVAPGVDLSSRLEREAPSAAWLNGEWPLTQTFRLARSGSPDGPFSPVSLGLDLADSDGVGLADSVKALDANGDGVDDHVNLGEQDIFFGRLRLDGTFGSELAALPVNFVIERWTGNAWQPNLQDSCSGIALSAIAYPSGDIATPANRTVSLNSGSTTGEYAAIDAAQGEVVFSAGDAGHYFSAPGAGNTGEFTVNVDLTLYPWLRFDWNQDGDYGDQNLPPATFTFGAYRGHDRVIYWQEVLQ